MKIVRYWKGFMQETKNKVGEKIRKNGIGCQDCNNGGKKRLQRTRSVKQENEKWQNSITSKSM